MKNKFLLIIALIAGALFSVACAAPEPTVAPVQVTSVSTTAADNGATATEEAGTAVDATPTGAAEATTPAQGTTGTDTAATVAVDGGTPAQGAGTAVIPQTGPGDAGIPDDLDEVIRVLRTAGATVEIGDEPIQEDIVPIPGQSITINGEEVQIFTFATAEELEALASQLANQDDPEDEPEFYKLGNMLVRYAGSQPDVRDLLEDVLGAQAAGQ